MTLSSCFFNCSWFDNSGEKKAKEEYGTLQKLLDRCYDYSRYYIYIHEHADQKSDYKGLDTDATIYTILHNSIFVEIEEFKTPNRNGFGPFVDYVLGRGGDSVHIYENNKGYYTHTYDSLSPALCVYFALDVDSVTSLFEFVRALPTQGKPLY